MNKTNTTDSTLNMIKSVCAERDRKERDGLMANRLEMDKRDEASFFRDYKKDTFYRFDLMEKANWERLQLEM